MRLFEQIDIIRRFLRDPDGNLWDDDLLIDLWNQVQSDFFAQTQCLENVRALPIPPRFQISYMHDFEYGYAGADNAYRCLYPQRSEYVCTAPWETQEYVLISGDAPAAGAWPIHPWEAWQSYQTDMLPPMPLPVTLDVTLGLYYDEEPIEPSTLKLIQSDDPSWRGREGEPHCYARTNELDNQIVLYPRPSTAGVNDDYDSQTAINMDGDVVGTEQGVIIRRTGTVLGSDLGAAYDIVDAEDNLLLLYRERPQEMTATTDEIDIPAYLHKYIRSGVISAAYLANTDGKIPSLMDYWGQRYKLGVDATKRFLRMRKQDRDYRLMAQGASASKRRRHPRLPDSYPPI